MSTKVFQKRVDVDLLDRVNAIYNSLGTNVGDAFVMFLKKSEEVRGLPFELRQSTITDEELEQMILTELEGTMIDKINQEEFFDETFPEYR